MIYSRSLFYDFSLDPSTETSSIVSASSSPIRCDDCTSSACSISLVLDDSVYGVISLFMTRHRQPPSRRRRRPRPVVAADASASLDRSLPLLYLSCTSPLPPLYLSSTSSSSSRHLRVLIVFSAFGCIIPDQLADSLVRLVRLVRSSRLCLFSLSVSSLCLFFSPWLVFLRQYATATKIRAPSASLPKTRCSARSSRASPSTSSTSSGCSPRSCAPCWPRWA
mmetsp:Transcript_22327/g.69940  ORF Transcript_22327/g.69940 Transcript_22327/m.69940 type:complete len:222 (+) Transcript_22327:4373-5038(+)